jgi:hypothetical protein
MEPISESEGTQLKRYFGLLFPVIDGSKPTSDFMHQLSHRGFCGESVSVNHRNIFPGSERASRVGVSELELRQDDFSVGARNPDCNLGTEPPFLVHARPNAIAQTVSANALAINILLDDIASTPVSRR